jgi:hypothetical protein
MITSIIAFTPAARNIQRKFAAANAPQKIQDTDISLCM